MYRGTRALVCAMVLALTLHCAAGANDDLDTLRDEVDILVDELKKSNDDAKKMSQQLGALTRQMMLQQLFIEERLRSEGQSGIKQVRNGGGGTKSYHSASHIGKRVAAIHDHSNNIRTVGMGEFIGVLNGVEFRTRHNDYRLYMPSTKTRDYHTTEDLPFPDVPPEVTQKKTVKEQVEEMVKWFRAWKFGNDTQRDHRKYFKPTLCYLEGSWTKSTKKIDEPFDSDRHFVDASSWFDLQEKIRFTSYTGRKDNLENFAYLPTTIMETLNETTAVFAQWNYRILCHPLKRDVPLNRLRMVDDLGSRLSFHHTIEEQSKTRAARFQVNPRDSNTWREASGKFGFLDELMEEIPGKDNYQSNIADNAFGQLAYSMDPEKKDKPLNAGYYHRFYKVLQKGAMGVQTRQRGFSDPSVFMAMNTQDKVAGLTLNVCKGKGKKKQCQKHGQKWSYAIPLELIYLTPLNKWNPHNLKYKGENKSPEGQTVSANGRNGGLTADKAFDGVNSRIYYLTPNEFFVGTETHTDNADTARGSVGVLDADGEVRKVRATGIRIFFPNIPGVGTLRQRYPIMPVHAEGSTTWKELEAVQDFLMESKTHARLFREKLSAQGDNNGTTTPDKNTDTTLLTGRSRKQDFNGVNVPIHDHEITLTVDEVESLMKGGQVTKTTSEVQSHSHEITIVWRKRRQGGFFFIAKCASTPTIIKLGAAKCRDEHAARMRVVADQ